MKTPTKEQVKKYFSYSIIIVLLLLLFFCKNGVIDSIKEKGNHDIEIKIDTVYTEVHDTILKQVPVVIVKEIPVEGKEYTPTENIDSCKFRFNDLVKKHTILRVYQDTIKFDSLGVTGTLRIRDSIWLNKLKGKRQYISDLKFPTIEKTITITKKDPPVRQFYIGGNLYGDKQQITTITPGVLYKDRKDRIYQANLGINFDGSLVYGVGYYKKISFKKKK